MPVNPGDLGSRILAASERLSRIEQRFQKERQQLAALADQFARVALQLMAYGWEGPSSVPPSSLHEWPFGSTVGEELERRLAWYETEIQVMEGQRGAR